MKIARIALRAILFCVVAAWVANIATLPWIRLAVTVDQFLAVVIGVGTAIVLLDDHGPRRAFWRGADVVFAAVVLALFFYFAWIFPELRDQLRFQRTPGLVIRTTIGFGIMIVGVLEATRRKTGPVLPVLVLILAALTFVGPSLPPAFQTQPVAFSKLVIYMGMESTAMLGRVMVIAATVVIPFIVFGSLLNAFGGNAFYTGLATVLVGRFRGGPAKVSVVGSAAFGMVSGSAVANVMAVGSVSIPLMARTGYQRHVAGAIEAVTSTGGQLMPPIMGASAFLMADILEIPYREIVVAAILPSVFYYIALFLAVDFEARRMRIEPATPESLGLSTGGGWTKGWPYVLPIVLLIYLLFVENLRVSFASVYLVASLMAVHLALQPTKFFARFKHLVKATLDSMGTATDIIMLAASAGFIIGILHITGFASAVTIQMVILSKGQLAVLLVLAAIMSLILGMGMPTVGVYILLAILAAPALVQMGVETLAAHLYVLYFGMLSMITPPVAIASFSAASIAGTDPWKTSFASLRVGAGVFLVPIAFVTQPELLLLGDFGDTVIAALRLLVAVSLFTAVFVGHAIRAVPLVWRIVGAPLAVVNVLPFTGGQFDVYLWVNLAASIVLLALHLLGQKDTGVVRKPHAVETPSQSD